MVNANNVAAVLSFISFFCLFLANLSIPAIRTIYFINVNDNNNTNTSIIIGLYGYCVNFNSNKSDLKCANTGLDSGDYILESNGGTKFLLSMHTLGNSCLLINYIHQVKKTFMIN